MRHMRFLWFTFWVSLGSLVGLVVLYSGSPVTEGGNGIRVLNAGREYDEFQCGHWSLFRIGWLKGVPLSPSNVTDLLPSPTSGVSLKDLRDAINEIGLATESVRMSAEELMEAELPVILHLTDPDHFVIALSSSRIGMLMFDSHGVRRHYSLNEMRKRWSGYALKVYRPKDGPPIPLYFNWNIDSDACVQFDTLHIDKADIPHQQDLVTYIFPFVNRGKKPLVISGVDVSCDCLDVTYPSEEIAQGRTGVVSISYRPASKNPTGFFEHSVAVHTNDKYFRIVNLIVTGNADRRISVTPNAVDFRNVKPNIAYRRYLFINQLTHAETPLRLVEYETDLRGLKLAPITGSARTPGKIGGMGKLRCMCIF
jgi:predicted double-glycine peptidase